MAQLVASQCDPSELAILLETVLDARHAEWPTVLIEKEMICLSGWAHRQLRTEHLPERGG